ncbi:hypothetical protein GCM10009555_051090 [Acrocarpospora macrocephala]|uniref:Uncharacterized protein n=2 Tax=Acrocarpospora macrocephala TaxID=150177 RepID=A0A5M3X177_9ACTN|nr:hypothetical protein Amac_079890 [Acrocarpospora macrocephala]
MRLSCIGTTGSDLPARTLEGSGNTRFSRFNVTVGREYVARAMALWANGLTVLIVDDNDRPNWKPIELFDVVDGSIPDDWEFTTVGIEGSSVRALWGYPTLIRDIGHHDALVDRDKTAWRIFLDETQGYE